MSTRVYILLAVIACCSLSCEQPCSGSVCADKISFKLIDKATQQDLVLWLNPKYKVDSMKLKFKYDLSLDLGPRVWVDGERADYLSVSTDIPIDTGYLRLTYTDIDTLVVKYRFEDDECCDDVGGYGNLISVQYNGKDAVKQGEYYRFEKE